MSTDVVKATTKGAVDEQYQEIISDCFGLWSICLWRRYESIGDFLELKEAFFYLIGRLLDDHKVRFIKPGEDVYFVAGKPAPEKKATDEDTHWNASTDEIISFLREKWPKTASSFDDADLTIYFYEIPPLMWRDENGDWHGS